MKIFTWAKSHPNGYECSSAGDFRFSALFALLPDGRTIEEAYQLDVKGYRKFGNDWRIGKGKPPLDKTIDLEVEYHKLWEEWAENHTILLKQLRNLATHGILTDKFASKSGPNQAKSLALILNKELL